MTSRGKRWIGLLAAALVLSSCSGEDDPAEKPKADPGPQVPELEQVWAATGISPYAIDELLRVDDVVVVRANNLIGLDATTGKRVWRLPAATICALAERAPDGLVVVGYQPRGKGGDDRSCSTLAAVDASTGKIVWQRNVGDVGSTSPVWDRLVAVGDRTVSVKPAICGDLRRYDLHTGKPLKPVKVVGSDDYNCDRWAIDGRWIAQLETPDFGDASFLSLYDADTGRRAFRRPFKQGDLGQIYSSDPLVIELSEAGHRLLWTVDPTTGEMLEPISEQRSPSGDALRPFGLQQGVVVASGGQPGPLAGGVGRLHGYDPAGGPARWSGFPRGGSVVGFDDGLIVASTLAGGQGAAITRHPASDVDDAEVVGSTPDRDLIGVVEGLLFTRTDDGFVAYALPAPGVGPKVDKDLELTWNEEAVEQWVAKDRWQDADVRPEDIENECPVSDGTLRTLGFHRLELPRPGGCVWAERHEPNGTDRQLRVSTYVGTPKKADKLTATQQAEATVREIRTKSMVYGGSSKSDAHARKVSPLPGVGDEAYIVVGSGLGGREANVSLLVRVGNVVVHVEMQVTADPYDIAGAVVPYQFEEGVWAAVEEVFDAAGVSIDRPAPAVSKAAALRSRPDLCRVLGPSVSGLLPGVQGVVQRPRSDVQRRVTGCGWDTSGADGNHDGVQVSAYATASSALTGASGTRLARQAYRYTTAVKDYSDGRRPVSGLGDRALVTRWDTTWIQGKIGNTDRWSAARVVVQRGNLTVVVVVQKRGLSTAALEQRAIDLARQVLAKV